MWGQSNLSTALSGMGYGPSGGALAPAAPIISGMADNSPHHMYGKRESNIGPQHSAYPLRQAADNVESLLKAYTRFHDGDPSYMSRMEGGELVTPSVRDEFGMRETSSRIDPWSGHFDHYGGESLDTFLDSERKRIAAKEFSVFNEEANRNEDIYYTTKDGEKKPYAHYESALKSFNKERDKQLAALDRLAEGYSAYTNTMSEWQDKNISPAIRSELSEMFDNGGVSWVTRATKNDKLVQNQLGAQLTHMGINSLSDIGTNGNVFYNRRTGQQLPDIIHNFRGGKGDGSLRIRLAADQNGNVSFAPDYKSPSLTALDRIAPIAAMIVGGTIMGPAIGAAVGSAAGGGAAATLAGNAVGQGVAGAMNAGISGGNFGRGFLTGAITGGAGGAGELFGNSIGLSPVASKAIGAGMSAGAAAATSNGNALRAAILGGIGHYAGSTVDGALAGGNTPDWLRQAAATGTRNLIASGGNFNSALSAALSAALRGDRPATTADNRRNHYRIG